MIPYNPPDVNYSLDGKTAVITGGATGIGYATAVFLCAKNVNCVLVDLNPEVDAIAKQLSPTNMGIVGDVRDESLAERVVTQAVARYGKIDVLVNSAGIASLEWAEKTSLSESERTISINLTASFVMAKAIGWYMIQHQIPGSIVNIASQAGVIALDRHVAYCASKGGIIAMTQVLALEWGKHGIRVNAVSPTVVLTELGHKAWDGPVGDAFKREIPGERFAEPDEIASVIAFLCSDAAQMITGHNLLIDGGYTIK